MKIDINVSKKKNKETALAININDKEITLTEAEANELFRALDIVGCGTNDVRLFSYFIFTPDRRIKHIKK